MSTVLRGTRAALFVGFILWGDGIAILTGGASWLGSAFLVVGALLVAYGFGKRTG